MTFLNRLFGWRSIFREIEGKCTVLGIIFVTKFRNNMRLTPFSFLSTKLA